jgi:protease I
VLLLVENGFEDMELMYPYYLLQEAGYKVETVGPKVKETYKSERGLAVMPDVSFENLKIDEY